MKLKFPCLRIIFFIFTEGNNDELLRSEAHSKPVLAINTLSKTIPPCNFHRKEIKIKKIVLLIRKKTLSQKNNQQLVKLS